MTRQKEKKTKIQKGKKKKRQKKEKKMAKRKKEKKKKRLIDKKTKKRKRQRPKRMFNIATAGQFRTLAMFSIALCQPKNRLNVLH